MCYLYSTRPQTSIPLYISIHSPTPPPVDQSRFALWKSCSLVNDHGSTSSCSGIQLQQYFGIKKNKQSLSKFPPPAPFFTRTIWFQKKKEKNTRSINGRSHTTLILLPISFILVITQDKLPHTRPSLHEKLKRRGSAQRFPWLVYMWLKLQPVTAHHVASVQWLSLWPAGRWTFQNCGSLENKGGKKSKRAHAHKHTQNPSRPCKDWNRGPAGAVWHTLPVQIGPADTQRWPRCMKSMRTAAVSHQKRVRRGSIRLIISLLCLTGQWRFD